jgi:hypothetical protein
MHAGAGRQFSTLEGQRKAFVARIASWEDGKSRFRPGANEWSAIDIVEHLIKTEIEILAVMRNASFNGVAKPATVSAQDRLRGLLLTTLFRTPARVKAPGTVTAILPCGECNLSQLASQWEMTRKELAGFLEPLTRSQLQAAAFRHPVSGWMTIERTLFFLSAHIDHHGFQLKRIEKSAQSAVRR